MYDDKVVESQARDIIATAYANDVNPPTMRLAIGRSGKRQEICSIGVWVESGVDAAPRFVACIAYAITGHWVHMPYEILLNGERVPVEWEEVAREVVCV